ncbi:MAG: type II secretion system protein GspG [Candidatus Omnitrophota bacterium]
MTRKRSFRFLFRIWFGLAFLSTAGFSPIAAGDIITLKDGASLRCEVIAETESPDSGKRFLKIRVLNSMVWVAREDVIRIEKTADRGTAGSDLQSLLQRMIQEGKILPDLQKQLDFVIPSQPSQVDVPIQAKKIMGWAYFYENYGAIEEKKRAQLKEGGIIPRGSILIVSPNSRVTLAIGEVGEIGLEARTRIRFDDLKLEQSIQSYTVSLRLLQGKAWFRIGTKGSALANWKRVLLTIDAVKTVIQEGTLYAETAGKLGAVNITYLDGKKTLNFQRGADGPYSVAVGDKLEVSPGSNTVPVSVSANREALMAEVKEWSNWSPEPLAVDLDYIVPPLKTYPPFTAIPALYLPRIPIDSSMMLPPETRRLGEILDEYRKALERRKYDTGKYPSQEQGLKALTESFNTPGWRGPYISPELPRRDLWGSEFVYDLYTEKGRQYPDVRSLGANRIDDRGLGDDIR